MATQTKASKARAIFEKHYGKKERKDIIEMFIKEAKLTKAGAGTYYQNLKNSRTGKKITAKKKPAKTTSKKKVTSKSKAKKKPAKKK